MGQSLCFVPVHGPGEKREGLCPGPGSKDVSETPLPSCVALSVPVAVDCLHWFPLSHDLYCRSAHRLLCVHQFSILVQGPVFIPIPLGFILFPLWIASCCSSSQPWMATVPFALWHSGAWWGVLGAELNSVGTLELWSDWLCGSVRPTCLFVHHCYNGCGLDSCWYVSNTQVPNAAFMERERLISSTFWEMDKLSLLLRTVSTNKDS